MQSIDELEVYAKRFGGTAIIGFICTLLIAGKFTHHMFQRRGLVFGSLIIPPAIISGLLGLLFFIILGYFDEKLALDLTEGLEVVKVNLVNFVFGALILGLSCSRTSSQHHTNLRGIITSVLHEGMPMVIYSQILIWGQSTCCLFILCVLNAFGAKIPNLFAAMVPLGVEAGSDVSTVPVSNNFWSQTVVEEAESLGMMSICFVGILLINLKPLFISKGWLGQKYSRDSMLSASTGHAEAFERSTSTTKKRLMNRSLSVNDFSNASTNNFANVNENSSVLEGNDEDNKIDEKVGQGSASLGAHISLIALTVFLSFGISLLGREFEIYMGFSHRIFSGVRMFKLSMCCALISMHFILRTSRIRFRKDWFMRLCGLMLDLIVIAALSNSLPKPKALETTHYAICFFFVLINLLWNAFCFFFVARQLFPNFWFERSLTLSADALGHCYTGLLFARTLDPLMESPVPAAYAYKLMLFFIPASGGKNSIVVLMTAAHGSLAAFIVCLCVVTTWLIIFETHFKHRFVSYKDKSSETLSISSARRNTIDGNNLEKEPLMYALSFDNHEGDIEKVSSKASDKENTENEGSPLSRRYSVTSNYNQQEMNIRLRVESSEPSLIISPDQMSLIASWLPATRSIRSWTLKYSLRRDGALLDTLMSQCVPKRRNGIIEQTSYIIIIEDSWGYIFGGFIPQALENRTTYYGSGESFVFSVAPNPEVYRWTQENSFFIISNSSSIAMGGGGDGFAFQLDDELDTGVSNRSATFNNNPLCSSEFFKCLNCEVWELDDISSITI